MANMFEYLDWRGDLPFAAVPPDEADYLIFSAISYIEMNGLYTESEKHDGITVRQLYERYEAAGYAQLELEVTAENKRAIELYKSEGFVEFGRNPKGFRSRESGWQELVLMRRELSGGSLE